MAITEDPHAEAGGAADRLRALAHSTRRFERPAESYEVIGDLLGGVRSLQQVLNQLARLHRDQQLLVHDDSGNALAGRTAAVSAMDKLRQAAGLLEMVEVRLDQASQASGRIVWPEARHAAPAPKLERERTLRAVSPFTGLDGAPLGASRSWMKELGR